MRTSVLMPVEVVHTTVSTLTGVSTVDVHPDFSSTLTTEHVMVRNYFIWALCNIFKCISLCILASISCVFACVRVLVEFSHSGCVPIILRVIAWWRHQMENSPRYWPFVKGIHRSPFPSQRPMTRTFNVVFDMQLNKRLSKQSRRRWFETPSPSLSL